MNVAVTSWPSVSGMTFVFDVRSRKLYVAGRSAASTPGVSSAGDPANQRLVAPAQAPNMSPDPGLPTTNVPASTGAVGQASTTVAAKPSGGFWSRVGSTLQFWK